MGGTDDKGFTRLLFVISINGGPPGELGPKMARYPRIQ